MPTPEIRAALNAWRTAERRWRATPPGDAAYRTTCLDVIAAWLAYQELVNDADSFVLVVDDERRYVAVSDGVRAALGYEPSELVGATPATILPVDPATNVATAWQRLLDEGRYDGEYRLVGKDRMEVAVRFEARAHHPIPGYHALRSWPIAPGPGRRSSAA